MEERRQSGRCPVCQGPMKAGADRDQCRNSLCSFNHPGIACPRCGASHVEATARSEKQFDYTCLDCQSRFKASVGEK